LAARTDRRAAAILPGEAMPVPPQAEAIGYATPVEDLPPVHGRHSAGAVIVPVDAGSPRPESAVLAPGPVHRHGTARRRTCTVWMRVTAYCPCRKCCGRFSDGRTACGHRIHANGSRFVAADTRILPFGTMVSVPGYHGGVPVPVLDRGKGIRGARLDVFFLSHQPAVRWGAKRLPVTIFLD
jgi:3D (Asp-Asp-Asp) domain-containing protein